MDSENSGADENSDEAWDGPSPVAPEDDSLDVPQAADTPVGVNELRVVRAIEDSIKSSRGPRIQVIKSRDIINAEHFSEKVFRVLKMHGFKLQDLTVESLKEKPDDDINSSITIYSINEETIKEFLGDNLDSVDKPMKYLFDNSMLAYLKKPVLISTVSDSFYDKVGLHRFIETENRATGQKVVTKRQPGKKQSNALTIYSFYFAAISFALSGLDNIFGSFLVINQGLTQYTILPFTILIFSLAAITLRAFSLGNEEKKSVAPVTIAILLFIMLLLIGIVTSYYLPAFSQVFLNTESVLFSSSSDLLLISMAFAVMVISLSRYVLFMGTNSGRNAYILSIAGILMIIAVVLISNLPFETIFGQTLNAFNPGGAVLLPSQSPQVLSTFFYNPEIPLFGMSGYFSLSGTSQYLLLRNFILLFANLILSVSYFLAIKAHKSGTAQKNSV